ncbi:MAG TPA: glycosyltransferase [Candidatus Woesebacteria bacterium]|nr:glycosyltransferase [Candidatus Woesebacteria bacterium]
MESKINVSIIIPTYNRSKSILALLNSLDKQITKEIEVLIIEQKYNFSKMYGKFLSKHNAQFKYFYLKQQSLPAARNKGVENSNGDIILFLDDDVIVENSLVTNHLNNYRDKNIGGIAGRVITPGQKNDINNEHVGRISLIGNFSDGFSSKIRQEVDTVIGCNSSWRKKLLQEIGGFDEKFTGNAIREDSDVSLRVKNLGYKIIFDPSSTVTHCRAIKGGSRKSEGRDKWYFDFFSNEVYFFLKHRPKILLPILILSKYEWFIRSFFGFTRGQTVLSSLFTPILGIINGIHKYKKV